MTPGNRTDFGDVARRGLVLLGCGKMGGAMLDGWLSHGLPADAVTVLEPNPSAALLGFVAKGLRLNEPLPASPSVAILAVKPQMMGAALPSLTALGGGGTLFVSIAAGTTLAALETVLGPGTPIVRAMPNTPAAIGRGISALIGNAAVDPAALDLGERLLSAVGRTVRVASERDLDAITALSGSGPAYVFLLIEAMTAAGVAQGLAPELAQSLARATVIGAGALAEAAAETPASQLRVDVTSPGGTTAAALQVLMAKDGLEDLMTRAIAAGAARSRELAS